MEDTRHFRNFELVKMLVPEPSQFNRHKIIDDVATCFSQTYRNITDGNDGVTFKVKKLLNLLDIQLNIEAIDEPENSYFFANYFEENGIKQITINEKHLDFFRQNPTIFRHIIGHEIGHSFLRHYEFYQKEQVANLFLSNKSNPQVFHCSSWAHYSLTREEVEKLKSLKKRAQQILVKKAAINSEALNALKELDCKFEPEWMFWQAEYFGLCLLIPSDVIFKELENDWNLTSWSDIYKLAEIFRVKPSMMKMRLKKMKFIDEGDNSKLSLVNQQEQMSLF